MGWMRVSLILTVLSVIMMAILCLLLFSYTAFTVIPIGNTYNISVIYRELQKEKESKETLVIKHWWQAAALVFWYIVSPVDYKCKEMLQVGNWHVCQDEPLPVRNPCLVYSFGIANDFRFDDAMGKLGCEVHSFDPSMNKKDHKRSPQVAFHAIGISGSDNDTFVARRDGYVKKKQIWKIRTLRSIMKELGHQHRVLDVLKIDVEGHEWAVVKNIMDDGLFPRIKQFYLEWHLFPDWPAKSEYIGLYQIYTKLKQTGLSEFKKYTHPYNVNPQHFNIQGDVHFVNQRFMGNDLR